MAKVLVLYNAPADAAAFDRYYYDTHVPIAKRLPGLRSYAVSTAPPQSLDGKSVYLVAELGFDSLAKIRAALISPEGQATAADLANFADGGASIQIYETREI